MNSIAFQNYRGRPIPLTFEDRTADITDTDFDEMYERCYYRVGRQAGQTTTTLHEMMDRYSRFRSLTANHVPVINLEFNADESLGNISFPRTPQYNNSMTRYLKKTAFFGSSLSRKFTSMADGKEYKWGFRTNDGQEWTLTTMDNTVVAHYDLKPPNMIVYDVTGNNLIVYEHYAHLVPEILATFLIMRHIAKFNL